MLFWLQVSGAVQQHVRRGPKNVTECGVQKQNASQVRYRAAGRKLCLFAAALPCSNLVVLSSSWYLFAKVRGLLLKAGRWMFNFIWANLEQFVPWLTTLPSPLPSPALVLRVFVCWRAVRWLAACHRNALLRLIAQLVAQQVLAATSATPLLRAHTSTNVLPPWRALSTGHRKSTNL